MEKIEKIEEIEEIEERKMRDYNNCDDIILENIRQNYKKQRIYQTYEHVKYMRETYSTNFMIKMSVMDAIDKLGKFVDISDPDISLPNNYHLFQTAEKIREDGHPTWFQLIGLIHDLGKLIYLR